MLYRINLLPLELQAWNKQVDRRRLVKVALITLAAGCLVLAALWACQQFYATKASLADAERHLALTRPASQKIMLNRSQLEENELAVQALEKLKLAKYTHFPLLQSLGNPMPVDVWLEELQFLNLEIGRTAGARPGEVPDGGGNSAARGEIAASKVNAGPQNTGGDGEGSISGEKPSPAPNYIVIKGRTGSVPSAGVYLYGLKQLNLFDQLELAEISEGGEAGYQYWEFTIKGFLKPGGGPGVEKNKP